MFFQGKGQENNAYLSIDATLIFEISLSNFKNTYQTYKITFQILTSCAFSSIMILYYTDWSLAYANRSIEKDNR